MKNRRVSNRTLWFLCLGLAATGCGSGENGNGQSSLGGLPTSGGASGGSQVTGGIPATGGAAGGVPAASGGNPGTGSPNTGGTTTIAATSTRAGGDAGGVSAGGSGATGGDGSASGGVPASGGTAGGSRAGGSIAVGGNATTGGAASSGGSKATGGASAPGGGAGAAGATATGGTRAPGGTSNAGGASASGGTSSAGGAATTGGTAGAASAPYRGVANSPCVARTNLKVSWYYNWMQSADAPCSSPSVGGEFVPMIWGHAGAEQSSAGITSAIGTMVSKGYRTVLGFNEPDNLTQSNISVATAISLWPAFNNPAIQIGAPGAQANTTGVAWSTDFIAQVNANPSLRVDFIAIHWYGWNAGSCEANASTLEGHIRKIEALPGNRPLWLTEWGCLNNSDTGSAAVTLAHVTGAVAMFARHPRLERYAWYPWAGPTHALANTDGSLTALGAYYASLPAYK